MPASWRGQQRQACTGVHEALRAGWSTGRAASWRTFSLMESMICLRAALPVEGSRWASSSSMASSPVKLCTCPCISLAAAGSACLAQAVEVNGAWHSAVTPALSRTGLATYEAMLWLHECAGTAGFCPHWNRAMRTLYTANHSWADSAPNA